MKLAYNISLPIVHILAALSLLVLGFARMMAWMCQFWVNDLVYFLAFAVVITGHWLLLYWGKKRELTVPGVLRTLCNIDYILFSLQLALVLAWLVWEAALPFLNDAKTFSWVVLWALLPVAVMDITALVLRMYSAREFV